MCARACHTARMRNVNVELQRTHLKILDPKKRLGLPAGPRVGDYPLAVSP